MTTRTTRRTLTGLLAAALAVATLAGCSDDTAAQDPTGTGSAGGGTEPVEIAFIGESSSTDVIWSYRAERMREEAERLGANFVDRYAEGDFTVQAQMIEEEVARGADAIIAPFFDPETANAALTSAIDQGVAVYALLGVPDLDEEYLTQISKATTDWGDFGAKLAEVALPEIEDGQTVLWPAEAPDGTYITDAVARFEQAAEDEGRSVEVSVLDVGSDPSTAASAILSYLIANPDTGAVATSGAIAIGAANTAMTQGSRDPGDPPLFGQVVNPSSSKGILDGYMPAGVNLELTESSYFAVQTVVDMITQGAAPVETAVPLVIVTKDNIEDTVPEQLR